VVRIGEKRNAHRVLVRRHEGMRPLGRHKRRSEDNIKVRRKSVDWINLADDRYKWRAVVNTVMNIRFS
jgi:hypothetical protein